MTEFKIESVVDSQRQDWVKISHGDQVILTVKTNNWANISGLYKLVDLLNTLQQRFYDINYDTKGYYLVNGTPDNVHLYVYADELVTGQPVININAYGYSKISAKRINELTDHAIDALNLLRDTYLAKLGDKNG